MTDDDEIRQAIARGHILATHQEVCMKSGAMICLALIALSGCTSQKLTETSCIVGHASGFAWTTGTQEHITVAENGSPCILSVTAGREQVAFGGQIGRRPLHGTADIRYSGYATLISYVPDNDYVGSDSFELVFGPDFNATVLVNVVPLTRSAAAPR
jgi:hypothetical protein